MPLSNNAMQGLGLGLGAAVNAGSGIFSSLMQIRQNKIQRNYEKEMYEKNKQDTIDQWNMSNMYNSPEMQMERLKKAGLNPNLVYGSGTDAQVQPIKTPSTNISNNAKTVPVQMNGNAINQLYDLRYRDAQTDLTREVIKTEQTKQELNAVTSGLKAIQQQHGSIENAKLGEMLTAKIRQMLTSSGVNESTQRLNTIKSTSEIPAVIENLKAQTSNTNTLQKINELELYLNKYGYDRHDGALSRMLKHVMQDMYGTSQDAKVEIQKVINALSKGSYKNHIDQLYKQNYQSKH